jgi:hypothetical protein
MFGWFRRNGSSDAFPRRAPLADAIPTEAQRRDELLSAYLDVDLPPAERDQLDDRLATDTDLRDAFEGMRLVRDTLVTLEQVHAPRSFALSAPAAPESRPAFGRLDLVTRIGAMTAAVAFVVVLAGDLNGAGTPIAHQSFSTSAENTAIRPESAASGGGGAGGATASGAAERSTSAELASAPAPAAATEEAAPPPASSGGAAEAAPTEAAPLPAEATVEAAAAGAATDLQATTAADAASADASPGGGSRAAGAGSTGNQAPLVPKAGNDGADADAAATSGVPDAERAEPASGTEVETATADDDAAATADGDYTRVEDGTNSGTSDTPPSLAPQPGEVSTTVPTTDPLGALIEDEDEVSSLAIVLGAVAAAFIAAASLLWWRRRGGATGPA